MIQIFQHFPLQPANVLDSMRSIFVYLLSTRISVSVIEKSNQTKRINNARYVVKKSVILLYSESYS